MYLDAEERKKKSFGAKSNSGWYDVQNGERIQGLLAAKLIRENRRIYTGNWKLDSQTKLRRVPTVF